jgi:hypothetical protein
MDGNGNDSVEYPGGLSVQLVAIRHRFSQNTPPTFIGTINGAIAPVEKGVSRELEVANCDLKNRSRKDFRVRLGK